MIINKKRNENLYLYLYVNYNKQIKKEDVNVINSRFLNLIINYPNIVLIIFICTLIVYVYYNKLFLSKFF